MPHTPPHTPQQSHTTLPNTTSPRTALRTFLALPALLASLAVVMCLTSCGGGTPEANTTAARVLTATITKAQVAHRMSVLSIGRHLKLDPAETQRLKEEALNYLISAQWAIQEAPSEHHPIHPAEIQQLLNQQKQAQFPGGTTEQNEYLKQTGQTLADLRLEAEHQLALTHLNQAINEATPPVTTQEIVAYYHHHIKAFGLPETREVWIIDRKTPAAATQVKHYAEHHTKFSTFARTETATSNHGTGSHPPTDNLETAIDNAKPHTLIGPIKYRADYFILQLKKQTPPHTPTLQQTTPNITQKLTQQHHHTTLKRFIREWRLRWTNTTECEPNYTTPKCNNYTGPPPKQNPLTIQ